LKEARNFEKSKNKRKTIKKKEKKNCKIKVFAKLNNLENGK
jgi:hypothetical protein